MNNNNSHSDISQPQHKSIKLNRCFRVILFFILLSVEMSMNWSSGVLSSASKEIKVQLKMNNKEFGSFGASNGIGRMIGCFLFTILVNNFNRKWVFASFTIVKGILLFSFKLTNIGWLLVICRGLIGFLHMPPSIYIPVWIDQFSLSRYKTIFMTLLQVVMPGGKVQGFLLVLIFGEKNWQMGFVTAGVYLFVIGVFVSFTPEKYFSAKIIAYKDDNIKDNKRRDTLFIYRDNIDNKQTHSNVGMNYFIQMYTILSNPVFITACCARAMMAGTNTALHFWISDYMRNALNINDGRVIFISYTIISIAGPLGGTLASTWTNFVLGGYENKHSQLALLFFHIVCCCFGISVVFMKGLYSFGITTMMFLVFSASALPIVYGIILTSVDPELKGMAYSIANFVTMALTSGPAPFLYGMVNDYYGDAHKNYGMLFIMLSDVAATTFILLLTYFRYRAFNKKKKRTEERLIHQENEIDEGQELQETKV